MKTTLSPSGSLSGSLNIKILILMGWMGLLTTSCAEKDLVYGGEPINAIVKFDWENAPDANPEGMTLLFFPADGSSQMWRFDISGREGGEIELLSGAYDILAFSNDLPGVEFSDTDDFDLFCAYSRKNTESTTTPTGMLYCASIAGKGLFSDSDRPLTVRMTPNSLSTVYHIRIDSVSGTERIKTANAVIKGVARSVNLHEQCNSEESCSLSAPLHISPDCPERLETVTTGFGNPDIPDPKFILDVIVTTSHGKYSRSFEITDQVMNSKHPKDVYINIKGLDIPAADTPTDTDGNPDVGISAGVDGWQLIEIIYS